MAEVDEIANGVSHLGVDLLQRCKLLLKELEAFENYLKDVKKTQTVELRMFKTALHSEIKTLEKLISTVSTDPEVEKATHTVRSSNYPFLTAVWTTAKRSIGIRALRKNFYWVPGKPMVNIPKSNIDTKYKTERALVDIVAQDGLEWIKVYTITEKRIIYDLAKAGWLEESSDEDSDGGPLIRMDSEDEPNILKEAKLLLKASKATRVRYRHPSIRLVLSRMSRDCSKQVADVLQQIRDLGVIIETKEDIGYPGPVSAVLSRMVGDPLIDFTDTLNVDCTMLFAYISDLSHGQVEPKDWHHQFLCKQMKSESQEQLLPSTVWPTCGARRMVCTREAINRALAILNSLGTETEKLRMDYLLGVDKSLSREQLIAGFQKHSEYDVPKDWMLPVEVVDLDIDRIRAELPPVVKEVSEVLMGINESVFLFGWWKGITTISSNSVVAKDIENVIEANRAEDDDVKGPHVWLSPMPRSLVGKEKEKRMAKIPETDEVVTKVEGEDE